MKLKMLAVAVLVGLLGASAIAGAGLPNTYQVTAKVTAIAPDMITVLPKDGTSWEIAKDPKTKLTGAPKVGDTVRIMYRMSAASIEVLPK
jgi:hypothetical protein